VIFEWPPKFRTTISVLHEPPIEMRPNHQHTVRCSFYFGGLYNGIMVLPRGGGREGVAGAGAEAGRPLPVFPKSITNGTSVALLIRFSLLSDTHLPIH